MKAHMLLMLILSIQLSTIIINKQLLIIRSMLMIDEISLLEVQIWKTHLYTLRAKVGGLVMKMISQGLNSLIKTFISSVKKTYEMKLNLDSSKGCYSSHVGLNMYEVIYRFRQAYISGARIFFPHTSLQQN